jgi:hypothetical protein
MTDQVLLALRVWAAVRRDDPAAPPELVRSAVIICHLLAAMERVAAENTRLAMALMVLRLVGPFLTANEENSP